MFGARKMRMVRYTINTGTPIRPRKKAQLSGYSAMIYRIEKMTIEITIERVG